MRLAQAAWVLGVATVMGTTATGCGHCEGDLFYNGVCAPTEPPPPPSVVCGAGTRISIEGNQCVPNHVADEGVPDLVAADGSDADVAPDYPPPKNCIDDPGICGPGTLCDANGGCVGGAAPSVVPVTDLRDPALPGVLEPAWVLENRGGQAHLMLYYTLLGAPASAGLPLPDALREQYDFLGISPVVQQQGTLSAARIEVDPVSLDFIGAPQELTELPFAVLAPELSGDGLWMIFGCQGSVLGGPANAGKDLCLVRRPDHESPFEVGSARFMGEVSTPADEGNPSFRSDPTTGEPVQIYWAGRGAASSLGLDSTDICTAPFDARTGMATNPVGEDGIPVCTPFQAMGPVSISIPLSADTAPTWTRDGEFFLFSRANQYTRQFDLLLIRSSLVDGSLDQYLGDVTANGDGNDLGGALWPTVDGSALMIAWTVVPDAVAFSQGSTLKLGRILRDGNF
jgi:hypothetical protein